MKKDPKVKVPAGNGCPPNKKSAANPRAIQTRHGVSVIGGQHQCPDCDHPPGCSEDAEREGCAWRLPMCHAPRMAPPSELRTTAPNRN
jgi:hypothetical protein